MLLIAAMVGGAVAVWGIEKCPVCIKEGLQSSLRIIGTGSTSVMLIPYYENGEAKYNPPGLYTTVYECSQGHKFTYNARKFSRQ